MEKGPEEKGKGEHKGLSYDKEYLEKNKDLLDPEAEGISKNEKKSRIKAINTHKEKAEKAALKAEKEKDKPIDEATLDPTAYFENRSKMITDLKKDEKTYPYPHKFHVELTLKQFNDKFGPITEKGVFLE